MGMVTTITLRQNVINAALMNMIKSQRVYDSGVASTEIADKFRVDGTLYGDTKLYHSFDIGSPEDWLNDNEAADLLKLNRNKSGKTQAIVMGVYKMIAITTDQYLSKQAFMKEGTFAEFTSFMKGSLRKIKKVYDNALIKSKLGTLEPSTDDCNIVVTTPIGSTLEEHNRLEAQYLAKRMKVLKVDLADNNRKYNSLDYLRAYSPSEMIAFWNVEVSSRLTMIDLPTIFHNDFDKESKFEQHELPQKWFGKELTNSDGTYVSSLGGYVEGYYVALAQTSTPSATVPKWTGNKLRIKESGWYTLGNSCVQKSSKPVYSGTTPKSFFLWAGDEIPAQGATLKDYSRGEQVTVSSTSIWNVDDVYEEDPTIAFTLVHKDALPYMSGFETMTEFWNARSLTNNNYLIFGHNELEFLEEYPRFVVRVVQEEEPSFTPPVQKVDIYEVNGNNNAAGSLEDVLEHNTPLDVNIAQVGQNSGFDAVPIDIENINGDSDGARLLESMMNDYDDNDRKFAVDIVKVAGDDVEAPSGTATEVKITS